MSSPRAEPEDPQGGSPGAERRGALGGESTAGRGAEGIGGGPGEGAGGEKLRGQCLLPGRLGWCSEKRL